jgi:hypothetical protein
MFKSIWHKSWPPMWSSCGGPPPHINNTSRWSGALLYYSTRLTIDHWLCITVQLLVVRVSQSQSYFTTDGQSVSMSWCRAQFGTFDQRYYFFFFLKVAVLSYFGAPSLTRSRVCHLSVYSSQSVFT